MESTLLTPTTTDIYLFNKYATNGGSDFVVPPECIPLETQANRADTIDALRTLIIRHSPASVTVDGGDGTAGCAVEAAATSGQARTKITLKRGGGNKKDLAAMTAQNGGQVELRPLLLERQQSDGEWELARAVAYSFGLGAITVGAQIANSNHFRSLMAKGNRGQAEAGLALQLLLPWARVDGEWVQTRAVVNGRKIGALIVSNGDIMAGGAMRFRQKLGEHGFVTSVIGRSLPSKLVGLACRGIQFLGMHVGVHHRDRWTVGTAGHEFTVDEDSLAQADGEHFQLSAGKYRIRQPLEPIIQLTTEQTL